MRVSEILVKRIRVNQRLGVSQILITTGAAFQISDLFDLSLHLFIALLLAITNFNLRTVVIFLML